MWVFSLDNVYCLDMKCRQIPWWVLLYSNTRKMVKTVKIPFTQRLSFTVSLQKGPKRDHIKLLPSICKQTQTLKMPLYHYWQMGDSRLQWQSVTIFLSWGTWWHVEFPVFWDTTPYQLVNSDWCCKASQYLHILGQVVLGNVMSVDRKIDLDSKNVKTYNFTIITSCTPLVWTNLKMLNLSLLQNWSCDVHRTSWTINSVQYDLLALRITNTEITIPTKCL